MDDFVWRTCARVVAYVELIFSILGSMVVFAITIPAGIPTTLVVTDEEVKVMPEVLKQFPDVAVWWMWGTVAVLVLKLWASLGLLSATEFGMNVYEALEKARVWRNVTLSFFVMEVVGVAGAAAGVGVAGLDARAVGFVLALVFCYIFWRGSFLFVVFKYIKELEVALASVKAAETLIESVEFIMGVFLSMISK